VAAGEMEPIEADGEDPPCIELAALLRGPGAPPGFTPAPFAPWGVQLAGNFSRDRALASFRRESRRYAGVLGDIQPMIIGTRLRARGNAPFFRVRVPAQTRNEAGEPVRQDPGGGGELRSVEELSGNRKRSALRERRESATGSLGAMRPGSGPLTPPPAAPAGGRSRSALPRSRSNPADRVRRN
jgi:hypothetical protein